MGLAVRKAAPRYRKPLPLFTPEYGLGVQTFTRRYFEELCSRLKPPYVLVIDNYQEIPSGSAIHEIIRAGISAFPENITCIIISRTEPPAAFAALEAGNKLHAHRLERSQADPRGIERHRQTPGSGQIPEQTLRLAAREGGWLGGGPGASDARDKIRWNRPRGHREPQPGEGVRLFCQRDVRPPGRAAAGFLAQDRDCAEDHPGLAEALTGNKAAGKILSNLNQRNYFTEKRTQPDVIYQYHALFREFLLNRAASRLSIRGPIRFANRSGETSGGFRADRGRGRIVHPGRGLEGADRR